MNQAIIRPFYLGLLAWLCVFFVKAEDPYRFFTFEVTYGQISPLGVSQRVIVNTLLLIAHFKMMMMMMISLTYNLFLSTITLGHTCQWEVPRPNH